MNLLHIISNPGVRPQQPYRLQARIRTSNWLGLLLFGFSFPYIFIFQDTVPVVSQLYIVASVAYSSVLVFNYFGLSSFARFLVAVVPSLMSFLGHISVVSVGQPPAVAPLVLQLSLLVTPWLVLDIRESARMAAAVAFGVGCVLAVPLCADWIEVDIDQSLLRNTTFVSSITVCGCVFITASLYILQRNARQADLKNESLIGEMTQKQVALSGNEAKLNEYIAEVEKAQDQAKQRQWASDGLAMFADILRQHNDDTGKLYDTLISQIVKYMKANQGGLFLMQEENARDPFVELVACYAYERKKHLKKRIEIGEGLIGQAVQENDALYLTDIPPDYINITSGLGKASPTCILIMPLRVNDKIEGVVELASFNEFEAHQTEFLQKLGESIAASVTSTRINARTRILLESSQQQSEELRAQEEEVRQNMEELMATQEEMERKTRETAQLYDEAQNREKEMQSAMELMKGAQKEMQEKQEAIEVLLQAAQTTESQLKAQEEMMHDYLAQIEATRKENEAQMQQEIAALHEQLKAYQNA